MDPDSLIPRLYDGIVSSYRVGDLSLYVDDQNKQILRTYRDVEFIEAWIPFYPGNSGGPIFDPGTAEVVAFAQSMGDRFSIGMCMSNTRSVLKGIL